MASHLAADKQDRFILRANYGNSLNFVKSQHIRKQVKDVVIHRPAGTKPTNKPTLN